MFHILKNADFYISCVKHKVVESFAYRIYYEIWNMSYIK